MNVKKALRSGIVAIGLALSLVGCGSRQSEQPFVAKADEQYYGIWINKTSTWHQKFINYAWGLIEVYGRIGDKQLEDRGTFAIVRKWRDKQGSLWYASVERYASYSAGVVRYTLTKLTEDGRRYEQISDVFALPREADMKPDNSTYAEWHRLQ